MSKIPVILWYLGIKPTVNQVFKSKGKAVSFLIAMSVSVLGLVYLIASLNRNSSVNSLLTNLPSREVFVLNGIVLFLNLPLMILSKNLLKNLFSPADLTLMELNPNKIGEIASSVLVIPLRILLIGGTTGILLSILLRRFHIEQGIIFFIGLSLLFMLLLIGTVIFSCLYWKFSGKTIRYLQFLPFCISVVAIYYLVRGLPVLNIPYMPHTIVTTIFQAAFTGSISFSLIIRNLLVGIGYVVCSGFIMLNLLKSINGMDVYQTSISTVSDVYLYPNSLFQKLYKKLRITRLFLSRKIRFLTAKDLCQLWAEKLAFRQIIKEIMLVSPILFLSTITSGIEGSVCNVLILMGYSTYRLSLTAIAREKGSLWILKTCGLSPRDIIKAKFWMIYLIMIPSSICFVIPFYCLVILFQRSLLISYWGTHLMAIIWGLLITLPLSISMGLYLGTKFHYLRLSDEKVQYGIGIYDYTLFSLIYIFTIIIPSFMGFIILKRLKQMSPMFTTLIGIVVLMVFACNLMFKRSSNAVENLF